MHGARVRTWSSSVVLCALVIVGCSSARTPDRDAATDSQPASNETDARHAIEASAGRIWAAVSKGDPDGVLAEYDEDAVLAPTGGPLIQGKPAIAEYLRRLFSEVEFRDVNGRVTDVTMSDGLAIEKGTYSWTTVQRGGTPMPDQGHYQHVWTQTTDGAWKVARYAPTSDAPAP